MKKTVILSKEAYLKDLVKAKRSIRSFNFKGVLTPRDLTILSITELEDNYDLIKKTQGKYILDQLKEFDDEIEKLKKNIKTKNFTKCLESISRLHIIIAMKNEKINIFINSDVYIAIKALALQYGEKFYGFLENYEKSNKKLIFFK